MAVIQKSKSIKKSLNSRFKKFTSKQNRNKKTKKNIRKLIKGGSIIQEEGYAECISFNSPLEVFQNKDNGRMKFIYNDENGNIIFLSGIVKYVRNMYNGGVNEYLVEMEDIEPELVELYFNQTDKDFYYNNNFILVTTLNCCKEHEQIVNNSVVNNRLVNNRLVNNSVVNNRLVNNRVVNNRVVNNRVVNQRI